MKTHSTSQSAFFTLRVLLAFTLCSVGALLAMLSLAATPPVKSTRANTGVSPHPRSFPSTVSSNANLLPPGVPLPPTTQLALNGQGDPASGIPTDDWSIVSSPNTSPTQYNSLLGVTCVSASDCWAVGFYYDPVANLAQTLIERWDGT